MELYCIQAVITAAVCVVRRSPTGSLHLGGLRTALYNLLLARRSEGGKMVVRVEDTDQRRLVQGATQEMLRALRWAGVDYDEGPDRGLCPPSQHSQYSNTHLRHLHATLRLTMEAGLAHCQT